MLAVLRLLVEHGKADPNARGIDGTSSLYIAAAGGWFENVKFYLEIGIDPSIRTACLWAPLHWAAANGHYTCVVALLEAGAEASPLSDTSKTPLDLVEGRDDRDDIQKVLRDRGALLSAEVYERMEVGDTLSDAWSGDALFDASRPSIPGSSSPQYLIDLIHEIKSTLADALESSDYDAHDLERVFHQTILWLGHVGGDPDVEQQVVIRKESQDLKVWLKREVMSARFSDKNEDL
jgi:ankyrin repeat protein